MFIIYISKIYFSFTPKLTECVTSKIFSYLLFFGDKISLRVLLSLILGHRYVQRIFMSDYAILLGMNNSNPGVIKH